jgi:hypothetical protein
VKRQKLTLILIAVVCLGTVQTNPSWAADLTMGEARSLMYQSKTYPVQIIAWFQNYIIGHCPTANRPYPDYDKMVKDGLISLKMKEKRTNDYIFNVLLTAKGNNYLHHIDYLGEKVIVRVADLTFCGIKRIQKINDSETWAYYSVRPIKITPFAKFVSSNMLYPHEYGLNFYNNYNNYSTPLQLVAKYVFDNKQWKLVDPNVFVTF